MNSNLFIILVIGILIFLGVIWLYKNNKIREGNVADSLKELAKNTQSSISDITGIAVPSGDEVSNLFAQISGIVESEADSAEARAAARAEADANTPVVNTTQRTFMPSTFFTGNKFGDAFCQINGGDYTKLTTQCSALTSDSCNATNCCVWVNGKKCMAGDENGPTIPMGSSATIDSDYYSYKYQCYGNCNSPTVVPSSSTTSLFGTTAGAASIGSTSIGSTSTGTTTGDCMTDDTSTDITSACVNKAWSQLGCEDTWKQIPMNNGWFNLPGSLLNVDTTNKNLYYKDKSTHVADITGQTMALVQGHMAAMAQNNPSACVPPPSMSNTDIALSMAFN